MKWTEYDGEKTNPRQGCREGAHCPQSFSWKSWILPFYRRLPRRVLHVLGDGNASSLDGLAYTPSSPKTQYASPGREEEGHHLKKVQSPHIHPLHHTYRTTGHIKGRHGPSHHHVSFFSAERGVCGCHSRPAPCYNMRNNRKKPPCIKIFRRFPSSLLLLKTENSRGEGILHLFMKRSTHRTRKQTTEHVDETWGP